MFKPETRLFKILLLFTTLLVVLFVLGRNINPASNEMFMFHDETQAARVQEFTYNLQEGNIPPRIAPNFSYGLGYPMFNFYSPFSYWITSALNLVGFDVITSLKVSFLLLLTVAFISMLLLMRKYVGFYGALLSAVVYTVSPYIAVEIFVRGNLAELWFFALFPAALYVLKTNAPKKIIITTLILSFLFTSHNVLSLVSVGIVLVYGFFTKTKWLNTISVLLGLLTSSYFLLPAIAEISSVYASEVATSTNYRDHFVCIQQLWSSPWGFAGSAPGCTADGISFMIGKSNILLGVAGLAYWIYKAVTNKKLNWQIGLVALLMTGSGFMVTQYSEFVWKLTESISSLFQFPWRLILFVLFGIAFFSGFITTIIPAKFKLIVCMVLITGVLYGNHEYFYGNTLTKKEYNERFLSQDYITNSVAYKVAEYLPVTANYEYWRSLENTENVVNNNVPAVEKSGHELLVVENEPFNRIFMAKSEDKKVTVNIHYAPYWQILVNNMEIVPTEFDRLGRPILTVSDIDFDSVGIQYKQTPLEQLANVISVVTIAALVFWTLRLFKLSWKFLKIKKQ